jgi:hypothetical protein
LGGANGAHGREDITQLQRTGKLKATVQKDLGTRDDHIGWFSEAEVSAPTLRRAVLLQKGMALELQQSLGLPLRVPSRVMCSCYPGKAIRPFAVCLSARSDAPIIKPQPCR